MTQRLKMRARESGRPTCVGPAAPCRAFTLIELLVSLAVMILAMFAIAQIFDISSNTTGRTVAHADVIDASDAVQGKLKTELDRIKPGLLIIESPAPTLARSEIKGAPRYFRQRHDRLVFIGSSAAGNAAYQSATDPTMASPDDPTLQVASSSEALLYVGPGIPLADVPPYNERSFADEAIRLTANEWVLAHRAILLLAADPEPTDTWSPPDMDVILGGGGMLNGGPLYGPYRNASMDAVVSSATSAATGDAIVQAVLGRDFTIDLNALFEPNAAPTTAGLASEASNDFYRRTAFTLQPRLADFRIEWTDGVIDPGLPHYGTRWFGLRPYWDSPMGDPDTIQYIPMARREVLSATIPSPEETQRLAFDDIEMYEPGNAGPSDIAAYRAVWTLDNWEYRPKALRFTYRIYDATNRLKNSAEVDLDGDGDPDPDGPGSANVERWGQEFSFVVPVP